MYKFAIWVTLLLSLASAEAYLSQEYIDSTVQEAYYGFVAATRNAGALYSQKSAITNAQQVVAELKKLAENDPNRRYILWRVNELQQQIFLEQEELRLKHEYERVNQINNLVEIFNKELFLERPSFSKLHALHQKVALLSGDHANQFATNINQKNRLVLSELKNEIETAFENNDYNKAEAVYNYAIKNKKYFRFDERLYEQWSDRIQAKRNADYLTKNIGKQVDFLQNIVQKNHIAEARRHLEVIQMEVNGAARHLSSSFVNQTKTKLAGLGRSIEAREDSLVQYNLSLINGKRTDDATRYMEQVLRPAGVDPSKVAAVDREILKQVGTTQRNNEEVNAEIAAISKQTSKTGLSMNDINAVMKMKADSLKRHYAEMEIKCRNHYIKTHKSEFAAIEKEEKLYTKMNAKADRILINADNLRNKGKAAKGDQMLTKKEHFLLQYATPDLYIDVRRDINRAMGRNSFGDAQIAEMTKRQRELSKPAQEEKAIGVTTQIYTALDKKDIVSAAGHFYKNESLLEANTYKDAFFTMKKSIVKEYSRKFLK